jgi:2,4-dienoyl-CoA reductase-like NADH-dependent reductase (Old Yellow Enzyme family)
MYMNTEAIFRPLAIGPVTAANRLLRSATAESAADRDGLPLFLPMSRIYRDLAQGGVGLIITGHTFVHPAGRAGPGQNGLQSDDHAQAWLPILKLVRSLTQAPIIMQLNYAGRQGYFIGATPTPNDRREAFPPPGTPIGDFSGEQIQNVIAAFGEAARRAATVGFDGVQLHMAHGFLLSECLSRHTNHRADQWGGEKPENRRRLPLAVVERVRGVVGQRLAVMVKLNGCDYLPPDGVEPPEAAETARQLEQCGVDLVEVSAGMVEAGNRTALHVHSPEEEAYLLEAARQVAAKVRIPVATVGGYKSVPIMLKALGEGLNMISLSRPLIREPDLPGKIQRGQSHEARCISCNKCFGIQEGALRCMVDHPEPIDN